MQRSRSPRVAIVPDPLVQRGGAERVFAQIAAAYPDAPVFTALFDPAQTGDLIDARRINVSYLARLPGANKHFRYLAPLYPRAFESFDLQEYDTVISSTTAWAKGVRVRPDAVHVCYVNTVSRFAFDYERYVGAFGMGTVARPFIARLARWDKLAATRPTMLIANSRNVARRIERYYGRSAQVLHCPVELSRFSIGSGRGDYFFLASRLLAYKRIDLAIRAADVARVPLYIAGTGPAERALRALSRGTTTTMLGYVPDDELNVLLGNARAAIVAGEEDFGLAPLEAAAAGRPTIAYRGGGALETIVEGQTGEFFDEASPGSLGAILRRFDENRYEPRRLRAHAELFSPQRFIARLQQLVEQAAQ